MPEISVIMAAYNAEDYLLESIDSILKQDFKDFELIICDDASTDSTWDMIIKAMKKDERIVGIKNDFNLKAGASRNKCINIARGEYIAIQDSDDISQPNRLSRQIEALKKQNNFSFVGTGMYLFDEKGVWKKTTPIEYPTKYDYLPGAPFAHGTTIFKKDVIQNVEGYRVAKETERGQDADLFMRLYSRGYVGFNLLEQLYGYRVDENTLGRRTLKFRYHSLLNRHRNFKKMGLMPLGYIYMFKPVVSWFIPHKLLYKAKKRK